MIKELPLTPWHTFQVIWFGQLISMVGTAMTRFALLIWAYQQTGQATTLALLGFFAFVPFVLASPLAGIVVDRFDRRRLMMLTDLGAGLMTVGLLGLYSAGRLEIWHLYLAEALTGLFEAFQLPAYDAAITMLVPKEKFTRANGQRSLAQSAAQVFAPFLGGLLLTTINLPGVMLIDVITFVVAVGTLLLVVIPQPAAVPADQTGHNSAWGEFSFGFRYIWARPGLLGLMGVLVGVHFFAALTYLSIMPAMVLARSGNNELALATVQATLGIGGLVGGALVSLWGGPKRRVHAVLAGAGISFLLGDFLFAIGRHLAVWVAAAFLAAIFIPFIVSAYRSIWQSKVPPGAQGRVFAVREMFQTASMPLGYLLAGPLADHFFEPAMQTGGTLTGAFGWLVGAGPGAGIGLMFLGTCLLGTLMSFSGYLLPAVRRVEAELPDYDHQKINSLAPVMHDA